MGIFSSVVQASGSQTSGSSGNGWLRGFWDNGPAARTVAGKTVSEKTALSISAFYAASNLLAGVIGNLPLLMYGRTDTTKEEWQELPSHPLYYTFQISPNRSLNLTPFQFISQIILRLIFRGNYYAKIIEGDDGTPSLLPLHPDYCNPVRLPDGTIALDCRDITAGVTGRLLMGEYIHIKGMMLDYNDLRAVSVISYAAASLGATLAAEDYGARQFANGVRPSGIITMPIGTQPDAYEKFKERIREQSAGPKNAHKTLILTDGATFNPISLTNADAQFLELRGFQVEEICRWLNVPPILVHHTSPSTSFGTGVEQQILAFVRFNLNPWLKMIEDAFRMFLVTKPMLFKPKFDTDFLTRGDSQAVMNFYSKAVLSKILIPNEARAALGYSETEWGRDPLQPVNMQEMPADGSNPDGNPNPVFTPAPPVPTPTRPGQTPAPANPNG